jgi:hypothetical protein
LPGTRPIPKDRLLPINPTGRMILNLLVSIKDILLQGRNFPWPRPECCHVCGHKTVWGHGFVLAFFDGLNEGIWLRRWRCPKCGCLYRMRPTGYFPRFQAPVVRIRDCLSQRIKTGFWPPGLSRGRQGHWLRALKRHVLGCLGIPFLDRLLEGFDHLVDMGRIPVKRAI